MVARRDWTRRWFDSAMSSNRIVSSVAVIDELRRGDFPGRDEALVMLDEIEMRSLEDTVFEIVEAYLAHKPCQRIRLAMHCIWLLLRTTAVIFS